ncbi:MAG TPA: alkaline phosphatase family protein, partial [Marmoricola sp.]|nr:alkaline phosphatase family protein [Marmoricola sp.]
FDNLYGSWGPVNGQHVAGIADTTAAQRAQVGQDGTPFGCLLQNDPNLTSPPLSDDCQDPAHGIAASHFTNDTFKIDDFIKPEDTTCPDGKPGGRPGGCTRDLVHRFYQEIYQSDGGRQDRYPTGSDAVGLTQGVYDTTSLPIYQYLHAKGAPHYVLADHFFQAAHGGSFLNHQWLIAARTPTDTSPVDDANPGQLTDGAKFSVLDAAGMPINYPLYNTPDTKVDGQLTRACQDPKSDDYDNACGRFAVNTIQPSSPPFSSSPVRLPLIDDSVYPNIGDRLTDAGISWNWYSGGWDDAAGGHPGSVFQYHHQAFNYFADYAPGKPGRAHLRDETEFIAAAKAGTLPTVSFVKPYGEENEHPGYASEPNGSTHLVDLLRTIMHGGAAGNTLVVVTYDEFGGQWDHVPPPGMGTPGVHDVWGPGTRIPALVLSRSFNRSGVDHTVYDTTSILATIEHAFGLEPLSTRDARVPDLSNAVAIGTPRG